MPTPIAAQLQELVTRYTETAQHSRASQSPLQVLRDIRRSIREDIVPSLIVLEERSWYALTTLQDAVQAHTTHLNNPLQTASRNARRIQKTSKTVERETRELQRKLERLPQGSPERLRVQRMLGYRLSEFELLERQLTQEARSLTAALTDLEHLVPQVRDLQARIEKTRGTFNSAIVRLEGSALLSKVVLALPVVMSLCTTITLDRVKRSIERSIAEWRPGDYHDLVLLSAFTLQVGVLTPIANKMSARCCWRTFERVINTVRVLQPEVVKIESALADIEHAIPRLRATS